MKGKNTIIYIGNDNIIALEGITNNQKKNPTSYKNITLPSGTVINGVILNEEVLVTSLKELGIKSKVHLVIDSSSIVVKVLDIPMMNKKQVAAIVKREFQVMDATTPMAYSYGWLTSDGGKLLCFGCPQNLLAGFINAFKVAGINLGRIDSIINYMVQYAVSTVTEELKEASWVLNIVMGENVLSTLFDGDRFVVVNRNRLFSAQGTPSYRQELIERFSSIVQFTQAQRGAYPLKNSFYWGITEVDLSIFKPSVEMQYPFIKVSDITNADILNCYCDKITFKGQIDLLKAYKEATRLPSPFIGYRLQISIFTISMALLGGSWYAVESQNKLLTEKLDRINHQIEVDMPAFKEYGIAISKLKELEEINHTFDSKLEGVNKYKRISEEDIYGLIDSNFAVDVTDINANQEGKYITIVAEAKTPEDVTSYVEDIDSRGLFSYVSYYGYDESSKGYRFRIDCYI